jgi:hypothetical protein
MSNPGMGRGGPSFAALLARSLTNEWGGAVEEFDIEPGGPVVVSVVLQPTSARGRPGERAWARRAGSGPAQGWAVHRGMEPGERFALCL